MPGAESKKRRCLTPPKHFSSGAPAVENGRISGKLAARKSLAGAFKDGGRKPPEPFQGAQHFTHPQIFVDKRSRVMSTAPTQATTASLPRINDTAPDFEAKSTQGPLKLSDYKGKWV